MHKRGLCGIQSFALILCLILCVPLTASIQEENGQKKAALKTTRVPKSAELQIVKLVRDEMEMLPEYTVFDFLSFQVDGRTVELLGQVRRPDLKSDAEGATKKLEGVEEVINHIELLPVSPADDHIRRNVYQAIYQHPTLTKYGAQAVPPIHIIVNDGKVSLEGMVANESDKSIANVQANSVPGLSTVINNLQVEKLN